VKNVEIVMRRLKYLNINVICTIFSAFLFTLENRGVFLKNVAVFTRGLLSSFIFCGRILFQKCLSV
jgi:hypothetical protein